MNNVPLPAKPLARRKHVPFSSDGKIVITPVSTGTIVSVAVVRSFHFEDEADAEQFARRFQ